MLKDAILESDPEVSVEFLDSAIDSLDAARTSAEAEALSETAFGDVAAWRPLAAQCRLARAEQLSLLARFSEAESDYVATLGLLDEEALASPFDAAAVVKRTPSAAPSRPSTTMAVGATMGAPADLPLAVVRVMAYDGLGVVQQQQGRWKEARASSAAAIAAASFAGVAQTDDPVPPSAPLSGLLGGAPTLMQRISLHDALAAFGEGGAGARAAAVIIGRVDDGPDPIGGYPQFWDKRAAHAAALFAAGDTAKAEGVWEGLCMKAPSNPPSVPTNGVKAGVNRAAAKLLDLERLTTNNNCEAFAGGTYLPCDDAGFPGLGGSFSPCVLYTGDEARRRLWPPKLVQALEQLRGEEGSATEPPPS